MTNLSDSAKKKRSVLAIKHANIVSDPEWESFHGREMSFKMGFDAGYEVGRDDGLRMHGELNRKLANHNADLESQVKLCEEALESVDCNCSINERYSGHLIGCFMPDVIESLSQLRGGAE